MMKRLAYERFTRSNSYIDIRIKDTNRCDIVVKTSAPYIGGAAET